ncbi:MAG: DUF975 family protein [Eubacteriales bacterium]|jgi:uncharacterized membrane protein
MKTASEYRREAKDKLVGNQGMSILVLLVSTIILGAASSFFIGILILWGPITVGVSIAFIGMFRRNKIEFNDMFRTFDSNFGNHLIMGLLYNIFVLLWSLLFVIPGIVASYSYAMAPYILADNPEMDGKAALDASKKLMYGKKGKLFCLHLSFIGWLILSAFTFGILYVCYVDPYMKAAETAFYESIKYEVPETYAKLSSESTAESV